MKSSCWLHCSHCPGNSKHIRVHEGSHDSLGVKKRTLLSCVAIDAFELKSALLPVLGVGVTRLRSPC